MVSWTFTLRAGLCFVLFMTFLHILGKETVEGSSISRATEIDWISRTDDAVKTLWSFDTPVIEETGKGKDRKFWRLVRIAAYDPQRGVIHYVDMRIPHPLPRENGVPVFRYELVDTGYSIENGGGPGAAFLKSVLLFDGQRLFPLAVRYPLIDPVFLNKADPELLKVPAVVVAFSHRPDMIFPEGMMSPGRSRSIAMSFISPIKTVFAPFFGAFSFPVIGLL